MNIINIIKYYIILVKIFILKPFVKIESLYYRYNNWYTKFIIQQQILSESNYNIDMLKSLIKNHK